MPGKAMVATLTSVPLGLNIDGWYNCSQETFWRNRAQNRRLTENVAPFENSVPVSAQCAQYFLPLCHPGQCNSTQTIPVFAKRLLATAPNATVFWVLQGGPGASSAKMEPLMLEFMQE
ncbi:hypothetical protein THRCLA_21849 [Thraustotheca clavata]|uniref:Uncharacterized protein n=1 Tax=Thraustotheca clavata TaxID=74557 RepID=A0A1V9ZN10_9STRA|nr:hypothetical protein THRCLA_21849 [Thraustotheca clavata]